MFYNKRVYAPVEPLNVKLYFKTEPVGKMNTNDVFASNSSSPNEFTLSFGIGNIGRKSRSDTAISANTTLLKKNATKIIRNTEWRPRSSLCRKASLKLTPD
jgi:hypothetical protein